MSAPILVVGAGPSGLGCATALTGNGPVILVDRIPVVGGSAGWDNPTIRQYAERAHRRGVRFRLGETAIRWSGRRLLLVGPGSSEWVPAAHLFFAGGLRPATTANLGLNGDRPAGVIAATVAEHLLQANVPLWRRVAVIGDGHWAETIASRCDYVIGIGDSTPWADEHHPRPARWSVRGGDRVTGLTLSYADDTVTVDCDGIVLADRPTPNRNVDGAVLAGAPHVTFVQPVTPDDCRARFDHAHRTATSWLGTQRKVNAR
jgi:NADPH-dependent 2,4-dienoyl-CoA reductase/sulfur reductase-like enzyme